MRLTPLNIQFIGEELAIAWNDGAETYLPLEFLRQHCPCAGCGGEPDVLGHVVKPEVTHTPASFRLRSYRLVGGYAIMDLESDEEALAVATKFMDLHRQHWPEFEGESEVRPFQQGEPGSE